MNNSDLLKCKRAWLQTLARFGIKRSLMASEELEIGRAIQKHGAEAVELALFGAGFEPKTENFDPSQYVKIARVLCPDRKGEERIDRFVNLGARARARLEAEKNRRYADEEELPPADPERVKEMMKGIFKGIA